MIPHGYPFHTAHTVMPDINSTPHPSVVKWPLVKTITATTGILLLCGNLASAIQIVNESPSVNYRFISGFRTASPAQNTAASFLGRGYDLSPFGWDTLPRDGGRTKSTTLITPLFTANAVHYPFSAGDTIEFLSMSGALRSNAVDARLNGYDDLSITRFQRAFRAAEGVSIARILDVSSGNYSNMPLLVMGSHGTALGPLGPAIGPELSTGAVNSIAGTSYTVFGTANSAAYSFSYLEGGDSGSPGLLPYNGELTLLGTVTWAGGGGTTLTPNPSTPLAIAVLAAEGYALRFAIYDNPSDTTNTAPLWTGNGANSNWSTAQNWTSGAVPTNLPIAVDAAAASPAVTISAAQSARGILLRGTGPAPIAFSGSAILSLGASGIRNETGRVPVFSNALKLTGSQNWEAFGAGIQIDGAVDTNGFLAVVQATHDSSIGGNVTGTGALAKDGPATLVLSGNNTYSGQTFLHAGILRAGSDGAFSAASTLVFDTSEPGTQLDVNARTVTLGNLRSGRDGTGLVALGGGSLTTGASNVSVTYAGTFTGTGMVIKSGATSVWTLTADNSAFAGTIEARGGILLPTVSSALAGGGTVISDVGRLQINGTLDLAGALTLTGSATTASAYASGYGGNPVAGFGDGTTARLLGAIRLDRQGSGTGTLKFTFRAAGTGSQKLILEGGVATSGNTLGTVTLDSWVQTSTAASIAVRGKITDAGGPMLAVNATGVGPLALESPDGNTYRGTTTAYTGAKLVVSNTTGSATGSGVVSIRNGAALAGTGRISGTTTVDAGGEIDSILRTAPLLHDALEVGGLSISGTSKVFVTSEDSAVSSGTFTLVHSATPISGSLPILTLPTGYTGSLSISANDLLLTLTRVPYANWINQAGLAGDAATASADPDRDSLNNLLEYALGSQPAVPSQFAVPMLGKSGNFLILSFKRDRDDVTYIVEGNSDLLSAWTPIPFTPVLIGQTQTVTDTVDLSSLNLRRRFLRLRVTQ